MKFNFGRGPYEDNFTCPTLKLFYFLRKIFNRLFFVLPTRDRDREQKNLYCTDKKINSLPNKN